MDMLYRNGRFQLSPVIITTPMLKAISSLDEFKGQWQATQHLAPDRLSSLKRVATIESVGSSTRIEGAALSDAEVEALLANLQQQSFRSRDAQEVVSYAQAMDMIFNGYAAMLFSENIIKQLHGELLRHSEKDAHHRGQYKTVDNHVEAFDANGKSLGIVFETASPFATPQLMRDLVHWFNQNINEETQHPLLLIGIFINVFLAIHPFKDGNGRLSRIVTTLLLLQAGYNYVPYSSMETVIEANKEVYYLALRRTQQSLREETQDWQPWLTFFLQTMVKQKDNLTHKVQQERALRARLPALSRTILELVDAREQVTVRELEALTEANRNTIKSHLKRLTEQEYLQMVGQGRGVYYIRKM